MSETLLAFAQRRPRTILLLGLALFAAIWLPELSWSSLTPPFDNLEQLTWSQSLQAGYYKHPPLPTWVMWLPAQLGSGSPWSSYLAGAACTLASMFMLWQLLAGMRGARHATVALLASLCVSYYTSRLHYYNHDVVLMVFHTLSALLCWQAMRPGRQGSWLLLGAALGLGALTKYQVSVTVACALAYWLFVGGWRDAGQRRGLLAAAAVAAAVFAPHALWLHANNYPPVHYAMASSLAAHADLQARPMRALQWLVDQLLNRAVPAWLLLGAVAHGLSRRRPPDRPADPEPTEQDRRFRTLLLVWALVPLAFMPLTGLLVGADLKNHWGLPFLLFAPPAAMEVFRHAAQWRHARLRPLLGTFVALQAAMLVLNAASSPKGPWIQDHRQERAFDASKLASLIQAPARRALGGRICVVSGPHVPAAAVAQALDDKPRLLIEGRYDYSPWVSQDLVHECGVLEIATRGGSAGWHAAGDAFSKVYWRAVPADGVESQQAGTAPLRPPG